MDFKPSTIGGLFDSKISFTITIYQRAYSWDKANWSVFLEKKLNCIGNLMLISGSHNASIGNKPFEEKLGSYKSNPLLKQQTEIPSFLEGDDIHWKTADIDARKKKILDFAVPEWNFSSVEI